MEHELLNNLSKAPDDEDYDEYDNWMLRFLPHFERQTHHAQGSDVIKIQMLACEGKFSCGTHDRYLTRLDVLRGIENFFNGVLVHTIGDAERVGAIEFEILKVELKGEEGIYCLKTRHMWQSEESSSRETAREAAAPCS